PSRRLHISRRRGDFGSLDGRCSGGVGGGLVHKFRLRFGGRGRTVGGSHGSCAVVLLYRQLNSGAARHRLFRSPSGLLRSPARKGLIRVTEPWKLYGRRKRELVSG